jgi:hypothetical protein
MHIFVEDSCRRADKSIGNEMAQPQKQFFRALTYWMRFLISKFI